MNVLSGKKTEGICPQSSMVTLQKGVLCLFYIKMIAADLLMAAAALPTCSLFE